MNYVEVNIEIVPLLPFSEILAAKLNEIDFESYIDTDTGLKAYIKESFFQKKMLDNIIVDIAKSCDISYSIKNIKQKNWNHEWEKNFDPVYVNEKCVIRAEFHKELPDFEQQIIITPKMSFGTGHHETTFMMTNKLFELNLKNKSLLDIGSGTGILAILASKLGAKKVCAIDSDLWAYKNSIENAKLNSVTNIDFYHGTHNVIKNNFFDYILVNINTNVILKEIENYIDFMSSRSQIIISGFLDFDLEIIMSCLKRNSLKLISKKNKNKWQMLHLEIE